MASWQIEFLKQKGLKPDNKILDIGCGVLRAGIPLIKYLEPVNYYGMDISRRALLKGHERVHENNLETKRPVIIRNDDLELEEVRNQKFDFLLAQSVLTHLPPEQVKTLFQNVGRVMDEDSEFYATIYKKTENIGEGPKELKSAGREMIDWEYSIEWLQEQAEKKDLVV